MSNLAPGSHAPVRAALDAVDRAGVRWCIRNAPERVDAMEPGGDLDVLIDGGDADRAYAALEQSGFALFVAPGHRGHRFFLACEQGDWLKLDVIVDAGTVARREQLEGLWVASATDRVRHDDERRRGRPQPSPATRLRRARPLGWRRMGPVVAVLGPDGAGKGTVIAALEERIPVGVTVARLGTAASGPAPDGATACGTPARPTWRQVLFVFRKWLRSLRRLIPAYAAAWRGHVVLCDRHPLEVLAVNPDRAPLAAALERVLCTRALPRPDAVIVLDAPATTLVDRKPEHPVAVIDRWRAGYLRLPGAQLVRADLPVTDTVREVSTIVWRALGARRRWRS